MTVWLNINLSMYTLTNGIQLCRSDNTKVNIQETIQKYNSALIQREKRKKGLAGITEEALFQTIQTIR